MKMRITWKLFLVTVLMFFIFITAVLTVQSVFIGRFYDAEKERRSVRALDEFCENYIRNDWNRETLENKIAEMSDVYDIQLTILNAYGYNELGGLEMAMKGTGGKEVIVDLHDIALIGGLKSGGLEKGAKVTVKGVPIENGLKLKPYAIIVDRTEWKRSNTAEDAGDQSTLADIQNASLGEMVQLEGTVEYLRLMNENEYESAGSPFIALKAALADWQNKNIKIPSNRQIQNYKYGTTGSRYKMFIFPAGMHDGSKEAVFAIVPLQPVDEAVGVIKNYLVYIFLTAIVFVLLLSFIYSRIVTQPLIQINKAAARMSQMDFSAECEIHSRDELGSLSGSLNTMAGKLDSTITELKEFVSNASHELKTPISTISGYVEALKDDIRQDKKERYLERLQNEVERMNFLVSDMLELSRMESNTQVLNRNIFDLHDLSSEILEEFHNPMKGKNLRITLENGNEPMMVFADRARIGQVIRNFLSNAIRYTESGGEIRIDIKRQENGIAFYIENEGCSIPEEKMDKIWDRFYRVEFSRARDYGGTGLGLAISAKILKLHDAKYGVRNTDRGVLFYFVINNSSLRKQFIHIN